MPIYGAMSDRKTSDRKTSDRKATPGGNAPRKPRRGPRPIAALARGAIEPALLRRTGLNMTLAGGWAEIAGPELAAVSRPERVKWGRRPHLGAQAAPGTLIVAAEPAAAMRVQHQTGELIARVNTALGYEAIGAVRIVQRPVRVDAPAAPTPPDPRRVAEIRERTRSIGHDPLREALRRLGAAIDARGGGARPVDERGAAQPEADS